MSADEQTLLVTAIREALEAKDWARAEPLLERWCTLQPQHAMGWHWRANCLARLTRRAEALTCVRRALDLEPENGQSRELAASLERDLEAAAGQTVAGTSQVPPSEPADPPPTEVATPAPPSVPGTEVAVPPSEAEVPATEAAETPAPPVPTQESALWREGTVIDGRYDVRGVARGGMGEVYFVTDRELGIQVAVKTPLPSVLTTESGRGRFLREAEAWIALGLHPNICTAYYVRQVGGLPRLFIEYLEGGDLAGWMRANPEVEFGRDLDLAIQIASGMHHAHTFSWSDQDGSEHVGLVHRDLKPANILLAADGAAKVTDFGLVGRDLDPNSSHSTEEFDHAATQQQETSDEVWGTMTIGGMVMGTPPYMPPEQWSGAHAAGAPADIYAFGCILYELLCRRRPYVLDDALRHARPELKLGEWEKLHRSGSPPDPRPFSPRIDDDLAALMHQCLQPSPDARPSSFEEVRTGLIAAYERATTEAHLRPLPKPSRLLADSWNNRGVSFATLGQGERARTAWQSALEADPHHIEASFNLSLAQWRRGTASDDEIVTRMAEIRASQTASWRDEHLAGRLSLCLGRNDDAVAELRTALEASGGTPQVARDIALALAAAAFDGDDPALWRESATVLSTRCGDLSDDPTVLALYALAMHRLGRTDEAARLFTAARRHDNSLGPEIEAGTARVVPGIRLRGMLRGAVGRVLRVAVDPKGDRGAALTEGGKIHVWQLANGETIRTLQPSSGRSRVLALDPAGKLLYTSIEGEPVQTWDLDTGLITHRLQAHPGMLNDLVVTPDGRRAIGVGTTGSLETWDLTTRTLTGSYPGHSGFATCVATATDGVTALSGGADGELLLWNITSGEVVANLPQHRKTVTAVAISRGSRTAVSGCEDGIVGIWDLRRRQCLATLTGHSGPIRFVSLSDDGRQCLSGSADGTVRLWDLLKHEPVAVRRVDAAVSSAGASTDWRSVLLGHGTEVSLCSARRAGGYRPGWAVATPVSVGQAQSRAGEFQELLGTARRQLAEGNRKEAEQAVVKAREIPGYERAPEAVELADSIGEGMPFSRLRAGWDEAVIKAHGGRVVALTVSADGSRLVSAGADNRVALWNRETGDAEADVDVHRMVTSLALTADGRRVIAGDLDGVAGAFNPHSGRIEPALTGHEGRLNAVAASFDGRFVLTASADQTARWWHLTSGRCLHTLEGHEGEVRSAVVSPSGRLGATGGDDGSLVVWDLTVGVALRGLDGHTGAVTALAWSDDGLVIVSAGADGTVRSWEAATGAQLFQLDCTEPIMSLALSPDGTVCAAGCRSGSIRLWRIRTNECLRTFGGHRNGAAAVVFTPDGRRVCSAGDDGTVRIWHLDWESEIKEEADWDPSLRGYLEVFLLRRQTGDRDAPPKWTRNDLLDLMADLNRRGFGWIREDGVDRELRRMAGGRSAEQPRHPVRAKSPPKTPGATPKERAARRRRGRIAVAALVVALPVVLLLGHLMSLSRVDYHELALANTRLEIREGLGPPPTAMIGNVACSPDRAAEYLRNFVTAEDFELHVEAQQCLAMIDDPDTVGPLLDMLRPLPPPSRNSSPDETARYRRAQAARRGAVQEVFHVLARMGDDSTSAMARFVADTEPMVAKTAASALAFRGTESSAEALIGLSRHPDEEVRTLVAKNLRFQFSSGVPGRTEAFDHLARMASDRDPDVRKGVAESLILFEGSDVDELAERLTHDQDNEVAKAVREILERWNAN